MDNLLNIDNMDMIKTLAFLHDNIRAVTHNVVTYVEDDMVYVTDLNDRPFFIKEMDKIRIMGTFVIVSNKDSLANYSGADVELHNMLTYGVVKPLKIRIAGMDEVTSIGDQFLAIGKYQGPSYRMQRIISIYNKYMQEIYQMDVYRIGGRYNFEEDNPIKTTMRYFWNGLWKSMVLNKETAQIDIFDTVDLDEKQGIQLVGTEWSEKDLLSINHKVIDNVKYKLSIQGKVVGKAYQDIQKPSELANTNYFMTYELGETDLPSKRSGHIRVCKGIIDSAGNELIQPVYDDIKYIGSNTFVLTFYNLVRIFSFEKGMILDNIPSDNVWIHPTLPLTVVVFDNNCWAVDTYGRTFDVVDLPKYFECWATSEDDDILKVNIGYKQVYISRKLVPITSIHAIAKARTYSWVKI